MTPTAKAIPRTPNSMAFRPAPLVLVVGLGEPLEALEAADEDAEAAPEGAAA